MTLAFYMLFFNEHNFFKEHNFIIRMGTNGENAIRIFVYIIRIYIQIFG